MFIIYVDTNVIKKQKICRQNQLPILSQSSEKPYRLAELKNRNRAIKSESMTESKSKKRKATDGLTYYVVVIFSSESVHDTRATR